MSVHDADFEVIEKPKDGLQKPPAISPALSLDLRIRWLETLLYGARQEGAERKHIEGKTGESLARRAEALQRKLDEILQANDGLRKFMEHCECNERSRRGSASEYTPQTTNMLSISRRRLLFREQYRLTLQHMRICHPASSKPF